MASSSVSAAMFILRLLEVVEASVALAEEEADPLADEASRSTIDLAVPVDLIFRVSSAEASGSVFPPWAGVFASVLAAAARPGAGVAWSCTVLGGFVEVEGSSCCSSPFLSFWELSSASGPPPRIGIISML